MRNISSAAKTLSLVDESIRSLSQNSEGYKRFLAEVTVLLAGSYILQYEMWLAVPERLKSVIAQDIGFAQGRVNTGSHRSLGRCDFAL